MAGAKVTVGSLVHVQIFTADYVLALDGLWRLKKEGQNMERSLYLIMPQYCKKVTQVQLQNHNGAGRPVAAIRDLK